MARGLSCPETCGILAPPPGVGNLPVFFTFSSTLSLGSEAAGDISVLGFAGVIFNLEKSCWLLHLLCHPQAVLFLLFPSANSVTIYPTSVCHTVTGIWSVVVATHGLCVLLCLCFFIPFYFHLGGALGGRIMNVLSLIKMNKL